MTPQEIKQIRKRLEFTRDEFAQFLGTHMTTIYRWETGGALPDNGSIRYLHAMKQVLDKDSSDKVKEAIKTALVVGGALLAIYTLLKIFFGKE